MKHTVEAKYWIGDIVYLITDPEQQECIITSITLYAGNMSYELTKNTICSHHYEFEISSDPNMLKKIS